MLICYPSRSGTHGIWHNNLAFSLDEAYTRAVVFEKRGEVSPTETEIDLQTSMLTGSRDSELTDPDSRKEVTVASFAFP